jgi:hypothetical protein
MDGDEGGKWGTEGEGDEGDGSIDGEGDAATIGMAGDVGAVADATVGEVTFEEEEEAAAAAAAVPCVERGRMKKRPTGCRG